MFGAIASGIGLVGSLIGSKSKDKAEKGAAKKYKKYSKELYRLQKEQLAWKKDLDLEDIARTVSKMAGSQRVRYAKAGVKVTGATGIHSADIMLRESFDMAKRDIAAIKKQSYFDTEEARLRYKAALPATTPKSFTSILLTEGSRFLLGGIGGQGGGWYGLQF
jgi:hypothetical protein